MDQAMWIVKIALDRPYTFIVMALLILILSPIIILRTPTDIFPSINIPVIAVAWTYTGLSPEELEGRLTTVYERVLTTTVDNIEHIESTTVNGQVIVKIFLQPTASIDRANAQVTAISQSILRQLPTGTLPPLILNFNASNVPVVQLGLSGSGLSEQQLADLGLNFIRPQLVTVPGAAVPFPFGGRPRQVMIDLNPHLMQSKGLSPLDVLNAVTSQNLISPYGTAKIGPFEYDVDVNASPKTIAELNDLPIKVVNDSTIYLRDVAYVRDGYAPQTNVVRRDGLRGTLLTVLKTGDASTIDVVNGIRGILPRIASTLPPELKITPVADQSVFVRSAVRGVVQEGVIAACLTGIMILMFLGDWRSTLIIALSIPLSILASVCMLSFFHQTINLMTLGGLALAVGILVDDATVTIENIERHIAGGGSLRDCVFFGAAEIATPALVSTLCICIVFLPMFFLTGVSKYLFVPLAEAVIFAMVASYILSRTLVPTLALYLLKMESHNVGRSLNPLVRFQQAFERGFEKLRLGYRSLLSAAISWRYVFVPGFLLVAISAFALIPWLGQDFFPTTDGGQFILHMRAATGTRIEEAAKLCDLVDACIRREIPAQEVDSIVDNIGLPSSSYNYAYNTTGLIGPADGDILVSLKDNHHPTELYVQKLRNKLAREFPGTIFYFQPADMVTQILNFGLPAPVDIQIDGASIQGNRQVADQILDQIRRVPGIVDAHINQQFDYPKFHVEVDRTKAAAAGLTQRDVASSLLVSLSGSFQTTPAFFLDWHNGVSYSLAAQTPQDKIQSLQDLQNIPINSTKTNQPEILADVASISRTSEMAVVSHNNIRRVVDVYANVQGRDLGSVGADITRIVDANRNNLPRGSFVTVRGQLQSMRSSYTSLLGGLLFSVVLVYLLIVVNFQSWLDPFIIVCALPIALGGIVLFLFLTHTSVSVPALMGSIMCMGVATANSILVVAFAKDQLSRGGNSLEAALEAGFTRIRPVLMTAIAMIVGMMPMALGVGDGGEENAPLGRAVIGGLIFATVATLFFVPTLFSILHGKAAVASTSVQPSPLS
jgi:CzcA family heavy metal efflux pump